MRKTKSAILEAVRKTALGLHKAGVMDQVTRREFDRLCLPPVEPLALGRRSRRPLNRPASKPSAITSRS